MYKGFWVSKMKFINFIHHLPCCLLWDHQWMHQWNACVACVEWINWMANDVLSIGGEHHGKLLLHLRQVITCCYQLTFQCYFYNEAWKHVDCQLQSTMWHYCFSFVLLHVYHSRKTMAILYKGRNDSKFTRQVLINIYFQLDHFSGFVCGLGLNNVDDAMQSVAREGV